ncbi:DUF1732 domain-containing protein, partial [Candidatus Sumerlaeota bacterium]|nr:DUF1732 domain-containing protein [Candidatus Sumerlaeota bacterium]
AHLNRFEDLVKNSSGKPAGKAMDFLVQEILREVNTLGSKSRDLDLASTVIEMKNCVERAREQVQNIE